MPTVPLSQRLLIVPDAHYRLFAFRFQTEMYELFHRHPVCQGLHMLCMPLIVTGYLVVLGRLSPLAAMVGAMALIAYHVQAERTAGLLTAPMVVASWFLAQQIGARPEALLIAAVLILGGGFVQMASHGAEPIPPPLSGEYGFVPMLEWLRRSSWGQVFLLAALSVFFTGLEIWASPRVWVLQNLHLLMRFGYRPELKAAVAKQVAATLRDSRAGWAGQAGLAKTNPAAAQVLPLVQSAQG